MKPSTASRGGPIVAIDGPAGAGKSTLALRLARALGVPFISTGLMYRAVAKAALARGIDLGDGPALARVASELRFGLSSDGGTRRLIIDGAIPGPDLESSQVESVVSKVAAHGHVRTILRAAQRGLGKRGCVMEGRDIASVVFPDADLKIHLEGHSDVRAGRREAERGGGTAVAEAIAGRDELDARTTPPAPAPGAARIDTTGLDADGVFEQAMRIARERIPWATRAPGTDRTEDTVR